MTRFQTTIGELFELEPRNDYDTNRTIQAERDRQNPRLREEGGSVRPTSQYAQDTHTDR